MKHIPLACGKVALVDDIDYAYLMQRSWSALRGKGHQTYAHARIAIGNYRHHRNRICDTFTRSNVGRYALMHRVVANRMGLVSKEIDHRNRNGLDNQRRNLRAATRQQNQANTGPNKSNKSGFKGVSWMKNRNKWRATIMVHYVSVHLGCFLDRIEAAMKYNEAAKRHFGEFAYQNKV